MIASKVFGITIALASVLAVTSSAMAVEKYDRMQSERSFYGNGAGVGAYANAYASVRYAAHPYPPPEERPNACRLGYDDDAERSERY